MKDIKPEIKQAMISRGFFADEVIEIKHSRANGEGTIRKRGNTYEGRVTLGFDANGKQIRKSVSGKTKQECLDKMRALQDAVRSGTPITPTKIPTLIEWLTTWIEQYKPSTMAVSTRQKYNILLNKLRESEIAGQKITDVLPIDLQKFINTMTSHDLATRMIGLLKDALSSAVENGLIPKSPAGMLRNNVQQLDPRYEETEKAFTKDEEKAFIDAIQDNPYRILYCLSLFAGLRRGEACAMTWDSIDFKNRVMTVKTAATRSERTGYKQGKTKTARSVRKVPISDALLAELERAPKTNAFLFERNGKMLNPDILTMDFAAVMKELGMKHTLHQLRHTFATRCHDKGIDIKVVQLWMGHVKTEMTLNTYTHATSDDVENALQRLNS